MKNFLDECQELNSMAYSGVGEEDKRHQDLIHAIEFEHNPDKRVYPHLLRKTTATNMVSKGCPRELAAFYLGHKNGNTKTLNKHYAATDPAQIIQAFRQYGAAA